MLDLREHVGADRAGGIGPVARTVMARPPLPPAQLLAFDSLPGARAVHVRRAPAGARATTSTRSIKPAAEILTTFRRAALGADVALIEGNKGLHDGLDAEGRDSSAALAGLLRAPVALVVDTVGMTRGFALLVLGYAAFDPRVAIYGVILNKVGLARQEANCVPNWSATPTSRCSARSAVTRA